MIVIFLLLAITSGHVLTTETEPKPPQADHRFYCRSPWQSSTTTFRRDVAKALQTHLTEERDVDTQFTKKNDEPMGGKKPQLQNIADVIEAVANEMSVVCMKPLQKELLQVRSENCEVNGMLGQLFQLLPLDDGSSDCRMPACLGGQTEWSWSDGQDPWCDDLQKAKNDIQATAAKAANAAIDYNKGALFASGGGGGGVICERDEDCQNPRWLGIKGSCVQRTCTDERASVRDIFEMFQCDCTALAKTNTVDHEAAQAAVDKFGSCLNHDNAFCGKVQAFLNGDTYLDPHPVHRDIARTLAAGRQAKSERL